MYLALTYEISTFTSLRQALQLHEFGRDRLVEAAVGGEDLAGRKVER